MKKLSICILLVISLFGCTHNKIKNEKKPETIKKETSVANSLSDSKWINENSAKIDQMINIFGSNNPNYDKNNKPIALFDWDNTMIKNDIGDAFFAWMLKNGKIIQPPGKNWKNVSPFFTENAIKSLSQLSEKYSENKPLPTGSDLKLADELFSIYSDQKTTDGENAFKNFNHHTMEPSYALVAQIMAGYDKKQIEEFISMAIKDKLNAPIGSKSKVGSKFEIAGYIRVYDEMKTLIQNLESNGFEVWIITASPELVVKVFAKIAGFNPEHVIGIRNKLDKNGICTYEIQDCEPDVLENSMITYKKGKNCWIKKVIFNLKGDELKKTQFPERVKFCAGDSDTDLYFIKECHELRLAIDRHKKGLMCHAFHNKDKKWIINPMFIEPKSKITEKYPCSTTACKSVKGEKIPCKDSSGEIIPDQPIN